MSHHEPPCHACGRPVVNGPNAASRREKDTGRWVHGHVSCAEAQAAESEEER